MIPTAVRDRLRAGAVLLVVVAALSNIGHTRQHADMHMPGDGGPWPWVTAFLPDIGLILSIMRLRYDRRSPWGWIGVLASTGLVAWAAISTGRQYPSGWIISLVAVGFAVIATGLMHDPSGETREQFIARHTTAVQEAQQAAARAAQDADTRATELSERLTATEAALTAARAALKATTTATQTATPPPTTRTPRRTKPQATPDVPDGLSEAETDVLMAMLGQGEMRREDIIKGSRRLETTVKAALGRLIDKGYVVSERRGVYATVTPGLVTEPTDTEVAR